MRPLFCTFKTMGKSVKDRKDMCIEGFTYPYQSIKRRKEKLVIINFLYICIENNNFMKYLQIILLTILTICCLKVEAVPLPVHYQVSDGLSNNYIHDIVQDSRGRVWIGTDSGLDCYDGYNFSVYKSYNSPFKSNIVNTLYHDTKHGKMWIGVKGYGIYVLDVNSCVITDVTPKGMPIYNVLCITPSAHDGVWIIAHDKVLHYDYQHASFSLFQALKSKGCYTQALDDRRGHLIMVRADLGISVWDVALKRETVFPAVNTLSYETVRKIVQLKNEDFWMVTNRGLRRIDAALNTVTTVPLLGADNIVDLFYDAKVDKVAILGNHGLYWVNPYSAQIFSKKEIENGRHVYQDNYGNLWLGTHGEGLFFYGRKNNPFRVISKEKAWCILPDGDNLWVGGERKLLLFHNNQLVRSIPVEIEGIDGYVLSVQEEDKQHLVFTIYGKLFRYDKQSDQITEILYKGNSIPAITFFQDQRGVTWITSSNGVYTLRNKEIYREDRLNKVLGNQGSNCIRIDNEGKIWIGTFESGVFIFNRHQKLLKRFTQGDSFFSNTVMHFQLGFDNRLWLATSEGVGLVENTMYPEKFSRFGYQQGLKDPFVRAVKEDRAGNVWVSTNNGLSYLNMKTHQFYNFDDGDGVPTNNFTGGLVMLPNGIMYATSLDGICMFDSKSLITNRKASALRFLSCSVLNSSIEQLQEQPIAPSRDNIYHFKYFQNNIRVTFAVGNQAQSNQVDYSYMVTNLSDSWTVLDENQITFRGLSAGKYTIRVRARIHGQSWDNASEASMCLVIAPPFWWAWYAKVLYLLVMGTILLVSFRRYKHHLQIKNDLELERQKGQTEQEMNQERLRFFTNIAHELRTPLTLIYGPVGELEQSKTLSGDERRQVEIIHHNTNLLLELINRLLEFRKVETNNRPLIIAWGNLQKVVREVGENFMVTNHNDDINYVLEIEETCPCIYFDKEVIRIVLTNLLSNAKKNTRVGEIGLSLTQAVKDKIQYSCIKVWDTGCGIPLEQQNRIFNRYYQVKGSHQTSGTGIGLALVKKLCERHHISIHLESQVDIGTTFTLLLDNKKNYPEALHQEDEGDTVNTMPSVIAPVTEEYGETTHKPTVLIVEDNKEINAYVASALCKDYQILQAFNGEEGLKVAQVRIPDIVICDIMMPLMDGTELTRQMKNNMMTSHIPIIILTAKASLDDQQESYECGADSYIKKPFKVSMLKVRMQNLLDAQKHTAAYIRQRMKLQDVEVQKGENIRQLNVLDQKFLDKINEIIEEKMASDELSLTLLAEQLKVSQSTLYRKMKALTGASGNEYIRKVRLDNSLKLILENGMNISEAAYTSGFVDLNYYRTCFKAEYGDVPSEYLKKMRKM